MSKLIDLTGQRFGKLNVLEREKSNKQGKATWRCLCDCGNITIVYGCKLRRGITKSCGCLRKETVIADHITHGQSNTRLYHIWCNMKQRCNYEKYIDYQHYGGRGIKVCDEWLHSFEAFYDWAINNGYSNELSIDRIDVNGNYEPSNCRWATALEQSRNRRNVKRSR